MVSHRGSPKMPLILVPYTLGAQLPAAPAGGNVGVGYYTRRKRFIAWLAVFAAILLCS